MAMTVKEVRALQARIDDALASRRATGFECQFLAGQKARLDQHGSHAMVTRDQHLRMEAIFLRIGTGAAAPDAAPGDAPDEQPAGGGPEAGAPLPASDGDV